MADQALELGAYLAQLEASRAMLNIQIAGVRAALGLGPEAGQEPTAALSLGGSITPSGSVGSRIVPGQVRSDEFFRMSIPDAIKRYLEIMKKPQSPTEIVTALKSGGVLSQAKNFYTTVSTAIKRLRVAGELANTKTGWGLSEWYAGRSGTAVENNPKKTKGSRKKGKARNAAKAPKSPAKASRKPGKATKGGKPTKKPTSKYHAFLGEKMRTGKTMKEAVELWRSQQGQ